MGRHNACDLTIVYRNMNVCLEVGIVQKCMLGNGKLFFDLIGEHDHHHHIICRKCERTERINPCLTDKMKSVAASLGVTEVDHALNLYVIYRECN